MLCYSIFKFVFILFHYLYFILYNRMYSEDTRLNIRMLYIHAYTHTCIYIYMLAAHHKRLLHTTTVRLNEYIYIWV